MVIQMWDRLPLSFRAGIVAMVEALSIKADEQ